MMSNSNASAAVQPSKAAIEHVTVAMGVFYEKLVAAFEAELGRVDPAAVPALVERRASWGVRRAARPEDRWGDQGVAVEAVKLPPGTAH